MSLETDVDRDGLIGRQAELEALRAMFDAGARLVSIVGAPGIGKTRLARAFLGSVGEQRACFVDLSSARTTEDLVSAVARGVDLEIGTAECEVVQDLARGLGPILLVLDNFDQLIEAVSTALGVLIDSAPELMVLVTSRVRVGIRGERTHRLGPLGPDEAVTLLEHRARGLDASFSIGDQHAAAQALVERLEGIPLAIELAAGLTSTFSVQELLAELQANRSLFDTRTSDRDADVRHATMVGAIAWSWPLLSAAAQSVLCQCTVFAGKFSMSACREIVELPDDHGDSLERLISELIDASFLVASNSGHQTQYMMYKSIRSFASDNVDQTEARELRRRHAAYYLSQSEDKARAFGGPEGPAALLWMARELDNLTSAHRSCLADGDDETAARLVLNTFRLVEEKGMLATHGSYFDEAVEAARRAEVTLCEARLRWARAGLWFRTGQYERVRSDLVVAQELAEVAGDRGTSRQIEMALSALHGRSGDLEASKRHLKRALSFCGESDSPSGVAHIEHNLGCAHLEGGAHSEAKQHFLRALHLFRSAENAHEQSMTLSMLGMLAHEAGEMEQAIAYYKSAREMATSEWWSCSACVLFAGVRIEMGAATIASQSLREEREHAKSIGARDLEGLSAAFLATAMAVLGDLEGADELALEAQVCLAGDPNYGVVAPITMTTVELLRSQHQQNECRRVQALEKARSTLAEARDAAVVGRLAGRLLQRTYERTLLPPSLRMSNGGDTVELPSGEVLDLSRRETLRRLVACLVEDRRSDGDGLDVHALFEYAWPDQNISSTAAARRVYTAIDRLRGLGFRDYLKSDGSSYFLDPALEVEEA